MPEPELEAAAELQERHGAGGRAGIIHRAQMYRWRNQMEPIEDGQGPPVRLGRGGALGLHHADTEVGEGPNLGGLEANCKRPEAKGANTSCSQNQSG